MSSDSEDNDGSASDSSNDSLYYYEAKKMVGMLFDYLRTADDAAIAERENRQVVQVEDRLWNSLPPELVEKILTWLPPATHFRFRGVCERWRSLLTSPEWLHHYAEAQPQPACLVMVADHSEGPGQFFCHSEHKWYKLPLSFPIPSGWHKFFDLVDADIGLVCCQIFKDNHSNEGDWIRRCGFVVCNPLTKASKILATPCYPKNWAGETPRFQFVKLHVDRQTRSFKVVILAHSSNPPTTIMYDSTTSRWSACGSYPSRHIIGYRMFVRKNVIYKYDKFGAAGMVAFDTDTGLWSDVEVEWPCAWTTNCFIVSHNNRTFLVKIDPAAEEPICVWKLRDETSSFSESSWIMVSLGVPSAIKPLVGALNWCVSQGDWIVFTSSLMFPVRWLRYTFATKSWRVMPIREFEGHGYTTRHASYNWEPRLDVNVQSDPLQNDKSYDKSDFLWGL